MNLTKTGGRLEDLGWPTHLQRMASKIAGRAKRPEEVFVLEEQEEPFSVEIERQIQDECDEDKECENA